MKKIKDLLGSAVSKINDNDLKMSYVNNQLYISGDFKIIDITDLQIIIKTQKQMIYIKGRNLNVRQLLANEVLIDGTIKIIEFR